MVEVSSARKYFAWFRPAAAGLRRNWQGVLNRIVDPRFRGKNRSEREKMALPLIRSLPDETQQDLTILLLLAPEELEDSLMNREYEEPSKSLL